MNDMLTVISELLISSIVLGGGGINYFQCGTFVLVLLAMHYVLCQAYRHDIFIMYVCVCVCLIFFEM